MMGYASKSDKHTEIETAAETVTDVSERVRNSSEVYAKILEVADAEQAKDTVRINKGHTQKEWKIKREEITNILKKPRHFYF